MAQAQLAIPASPPATNTLPGLRSLRLQEAFLNGHLYPPPSPDRLTSFLQESLFLGDIHNHQNRDLMPEHL